MNKLLIVLLFGLPGAAALAQVPIPQGKALPPGLYVHVTDGLILVTNPGGTQSFQAGQFGFTPSLHQPPVVVPANPGLHFTPPPAFNPSTPTTTANAGKSNTVDCEVR